jgi:hypothetical protein
MEQQENGRSSAESARFGPPPAAPRFYVLESEEQIQSQRARNEQSARARLLTPKNATGRRGVLPAAPRDPLRLAQSIVAATRQFAALPPPVPPTLALYYYSFYYCYCFYFYLIINFSSSFSCLIVKYFNIFKHPLGAALDCPMGSDAPRHRRGRRGVNRARSDLVRRLVAAQDGGGGPRARVRVAFCRQGSSRVPLIPRGQEAR